MCSVFRIKQISHKADECYEKDGCETSYQEQLQDSMFSSIWSVLQSPSSVSVTPDFSTYKTDFFSKLAGPFLLRAEEACPGSPLVEGKDRPQKVVVGGGSGFVGGEVCRQLRKAGYEVILISRVQRQYGVTWEEVEKDGLPEGTHGVVNLAGQNVLDPFRLVFRSG